MDKNRQILTLNNYAKQLAKCACVRLRTFGLSIIARINAYAYSYSRDIVT